MRKWLWIVSAVVATGVALTACGDGGGGGGHALVPGTSPGATTSSSAASTTSTTAEVGRPANPGTPGVLADCTNPPPLSLQVDPSSIVVACADGGLGAQDLTWSTWTSTGASGSGTIYENDCTPDCADGVFKDYPASITLSDVQQTPAGEAFTVLNASYKGAGPDGHQSDVFHLEIPPV